MINISNSVKQMYKTGSGMKIMVIDFKNSGVTIDNSGIVKNTFSIQENLCAPTEFRFGMANSSQCKVTIFRRPDLEEIEGDEMKVTQYIIAEDLAVYYVNAARYKKLSCVFDRYYEDIVKLVPGAMEEGNEVGIYKYDDFDIYNLIWSADLLDKLYLKREYYQGYEFGVKSDFAVSQGESLFIDMEFKITYIPDWFRAYYGDVDEIFLYLSQKWDTEKNFSEDDIIGTIKVKLNGTNRIQQTIKLKGGEGYKKSIFIVYGSVDGSIRSRVSLHQRNREREIFVGYDLQYICSCSVYNVGEVPLGVFKISSYTYKNNSIVGEIVAYDRLYKETLDESYLVKGGNVVSVQDIMNDIGHELEMKFGGTVYEVKKMWSPETNSESKIILESLYPDGLRERVVIDTAGFQIIDYDREKKYRIDTILNFNEESSRRVIYGLEEQYGIIQKVRDDDEWASKYYSNGTGAGCWDDYNYDYPSEIDNDGVFVMDRIESVTFDKFAGKDLYTAEKEMGVGHEIVSSATINKKAAVLGKDFGYTSKEDEYTYIEQVFSENRKIKLRVRQFGLMCNVDKYNEDVSIEYTVYDYVLDFIKDDLYKILEICAIGRDLRKDSNWNRYVFHRPEDETIFNELLRQIGQTITTSSFSVSGNYGKGQIKYIDSVRAYTDVFNNIGKYWIHDNIAGIVEYHNTEWLMEYSLSGSSDVSTTMRKVISSYYELQGLFFIMDRYGNPKTIIPSSVPLYPEEDIYPEESLYPSEADEITETGVIRELNVYKKKPLKYYGVCLYKNNTVLKRVTLKNLYEHEYRSRGYVIYDVKDNFFLDNFTFTDEHLNAISEKILENISGIEIVSLDVEFNGLPYVECGDMVTMYGKNYEEDVIVLNRTLSGVRFMKDIIKNKF